MWRGFLIKGPESRCHPGELPGSGAHGETLLMGRGDGRKSPLRRVSPAARCRMGGGGLSPSPRLLPRFGVMVTTCPEKIPLENTEGKEQDLVISVITSKLAFFSLVLSVFHRTTEFF